MIEFQRLLLGDAIRNDAFVKALKKVIVPGKTVIADIGSGTGYLSFVAEKLGAKECHLYEVSKDLLELSKKIGKANGMKRCHYVHAHSTQVKNPPECDVVISETLGNYALEENIIETMNDAKRFLKKGGVMIPQDLKQYVAPVTSSRLWKELDIWDVGQTLNFSAAKEICMNNMYVKDVRADDVLNETHCWDTVNFEKKNQSVREKSDEWTAKSDMTLYGFALWWESTLIKDVMLTTSPFKPVTHWKQIYLPLLNPIPVRKDQVVRLRLHSDSRYEVKINLAWETTVTNEAGKQLKHVKQDMRNGFLQ